MRSLPVKFDPVQIEAETAQFWKSRGLPPPGGSVGRSPGETLHQVVAALTAADSGLDFLQRAVRADADARFLAITGHRSQSTLASREVDVETGPWVSDHLVSAGVWTGGGQVAPMESVADAGRIQAMLDPLLDAGVFRARDAPFRACPSCRTPRNPAGIVYASEEGEAYLVRFPLVGDAPRTSLLVWTDAAWKLLGTTAVLVHPDLPYVRVRYKRRDSEEHLLVLRSAIDRLRSWFEGCEIEVLEERPGSAWVGARYEHPLRVEFPTLVDLPSPAGTVVASTEVDDSGTGIVTLVPAHGAADAALGAQLGIHGWPVVGLDAELTKSLQHKYTGLPVDVGEAFMLRDLTDSGHIFAQLRVRRGVPHCYACGAALYWQLARAWCLEPDRLPALIRETFQRLLPGEALPRADDPVRWPVSAWISTERPEDAAGLECSSCGRLAAPGSSDRCECGSTRTLVRRHLLATVREPLAIWATERPYAAGEPSRLYLPTRRAAPALLHQLLGVYASKANVGELRLATLPILPPSPRPSPLDGAADALRAALLEIPESPRSGDPGLAARRDRELRRLRKFWTIAQSTIARFLSEGYVLDSRPVSERLADLPEEDRAFLSLFERLRMDVIREYETGRVHRAHDRLVSFMEGDLRGGYLRLVRPRLAPGAPPASRLAVFRVLGHVLPLWVELYAPLAPFSMEAVHRGLRGDGQSVFERPITPVQEKLLDARLEKAFSRSRVVAAAVDQYRHDLALPPTTRFDSLVLSVADDTVGAELRAFSSALGRLAGAERVQIASPGQPWKGRKVEARPIAAELQKAYPMQHQRILRILEGMSAERIREGVQGQSLELVIEGARLPIAPSMIEVGESLPERVVPVSCPLGELYLELPAAFDQRDARRPPALTPDGFRVLYSIRRSIDRSPTPSAIDVVHVSVRGPLAEEFARQAPEVSRYLQGIAVELSPDASGFRPSETRYGRTARGEPWAVWLPGAPRDSTSKPRPSLPGRPRVRGRRPSGEATVTLDYLSDSLREQETDIRDAVQRFDGELGRPLIGPAKLAAAWSLGLNSFEKVSQAEFAVLAGVPGFGPAVASAVVTHFGGTVPAAELRARTSSPVVVVRPPSPPVLEGATATAVVVPGPRLPAPAEGAAIPVGPVSEILPVPDLPPTPSVEATPVEPPDDTRPITVGQSIPPPGEAPVSPAEPAVPADPEASPEPPGADASPSPGRPESETEAAPLLEPVGPSNEMTSSLAPNGPEEPAAPEAPSGLPPLPADLAEPSDVGTGGPAPDTEAVPPSPLVEPQPREAPVESMGGGETPPSAPPVGAPSEASAADGLTAEAGISSSAPAAAAPEVLPLEVPPAPPFPSAEPSKPEEPRPAAAPADQGPSESPAADAPAPARAPSASVGGVEVWSAGSSERAWASFLSASSSGIQGLCLSRDFPERLRSALGPRPVRVVWLSNVSREGAIRPGDLDALRALFQEFLSGTGPRVAFIEGIEYLLRIHGLPRTVDLLTALHDGAVAQGIRVWLPLNPALLDPSSQEELVARFHPAGSP